MAKTPAAGEADRNARLVLRLLAKPETRLVEAEPEGWAIETGSSRRRGRQAVEEATVRELARRDWLVREPSGSYRISVAGERLVSSTGVIGGEGFADQHRLVRPSRGAPKRRAAGPAVNEAESPLGWLRSRRDRNGDALISEAQYEAGERLRAEFTAAQLSPRVTLAWDACLAPRSSGRSGRRPDSLEIHEAALAARQRFLRALDAVGPELSGILVDVCCLARGLEAAERTLGWPQRSGKLVLQIALTQLARHYGLLGQAEARHPPSIRHWGLDGYRPRIGLASPDGGDGSQA